MARVSTCLSEDDFITLRTLLSLFTTLLPQAALAVTGFSLLTPERLWDMARLGGPLVSPDGKHVVFTVTSFPRGAGGPAIDLWLVAADGKGEARQLTRNPGPDYSPSWSPDSNRIIYASSRAREPAEILVLNLQGGEPQRVATFPTGAYQPRFRPNTDAIIFEAETYPDIDADVEALGLRLAAEERTGTAAVATESRIARRAGGAVAEDRVVHLFEVVPETGKLRDLTPGFRGSVLLAPFDWDLSPDGRFVAFTGLSDEPPYLRRDRDIHLLEIDSGKLVNLTADREGSAFDPVFGPGNVLVFGETSSPDALAENTRLVRYDDQRFDVITNPQVHSPDYWHVDPGADHLYYQAQEGGGRHIFRTGLSGGRGRRIVSGGDTTELDIGPRGNLFFLHSTFNRPAALQRTDANGNHRRQLTSLNRALIEDTRMGSAREISFRGYDGREVHGFLMLPPGFNPESRWPVLILLHGGPHSAWLESFYYRWNLLTFASPGYLVAAINPHGSTGFGQEFANAVVGDPLRPATHDVEAAIEHLATLPYVDIERLGIVGGSYGGYLTHWILTHSSARFRAAAVHAGVFDLMLQYASDFPWGRHRTYGALPWEAPDRYHALSPSTRAAELETPVLLLHGERDTRVPVAHSLLAHNILTARGVPSRIVLFPSEGHAIDDRAAAERWWREIFHWLDRFLPPGPGTDS